MILKVDDFNFNVPKILLYVNDQYKYIYVYISYWNTTNMMIALQNFKKPVRAP